MRAVMTSLLDNFTEAGRCDLVADVCEPYPIPIMCELLGAPKSDWKLFSRLATDLLAIFNNDLVNDGPRIIAAREELDVYTRDSSSAAAANRPTISSPPSSPPRRRATS